MEKFCENVRKTIENLKAAGGSDDQAFDKVFECLTETHVTSFNETIRIWKQVKDQSGSDDASSISCLLHKARSEYQSLLARRKWPKVGKTHKSETNDVSSTKRKHDSDIASLLAKSELRMNKSFKALLATDRRHKKPTSKRPKLQQASKHSWDNQYGRKKDFTDRPAFLTWLHTEPQDISKSATKNDLKWHWCTKCTRYANHKTPDCKKTEKGKITKSSYVAKSVSSAAAHQSDDDLVDTDDESQFSVSFFRSSQSGSSSE